MVGLKLNHVSKRGPICFFLFQTLIVSSTCTIWRKDLSLLYRISHVQLRALQIWVKAKEDCLMLPNLASFQQNAICIRAWPILMNIRCPPSKRSKTSQDIVVASFPKSGKSRYLSLCVINFIEETHVNTYKIHLASFHDIETHFWL